MLYKEFPGVNTFLVEMSKILLEKSVVRETRGQKCFELPFPIIIKISDPTARIITIPQRRWNKVLPYAESLWLAAGRNDMRMIGSYLKQLSDFSDDNETMRAGYGPRLRRYHGILQDYKLDSSSSFLLSQPSGTEVIVDQFRFIEDSFKLDPFTRQAVITLGDPAKDCFDINGNRKKTKDFPCTREIQFIRNDGKLDVIVNMRSNDFFWGASAANIFNFTFMQEYFSQILGLNIGNYYHVVNNFHFYEPFRSRLNQLAEVGNVGDFGYTYKKEFSSLNDFDILVKKLETEELDVRNRTTSVMSDFENDFFNDWAGVLLKFHHPEHRIKFANPHLNSLFHDSPSVKNS